MSIDQLFRKAHSKHLQGKLDAAAKLYREILRIKPSHLDSNYLLGTLHAENGQLEEAQHHLAIAESLNPASPYIKVNLGNIYMIRGELETAKRYFMDAIALKNDLPQAHFGLGNILENFDNDYDSAFREYQKAADLSPNDPMILQAIGKTLAKSSNQKALEYFARALRLNSKLKGLHKDIGLAALRFGKIAEAARHLTLAHQEDPDDVQVSYFLCIANGSEPDDGLKQRYVQAEFDAYAGQFDDSLMLRQGYDAPEKILAFLLETVRETPHFKNGVDLGCGTGLFGSLVKEYVDNLTGIDISGRMIEAARKRNCYDTLLEGEIVSTLKGIDSSFDLFSATDVIIYVGDIEALFSAARGKAAPNALFLLTTECHEGEKFLLRNSGRYAHSHEYLKTVAASNGFSIVASRKIPLRKESAEWLEGEMFIMQAVRQG